MTCVEKSQVLKRQRRTPFKLTHEILFTRIIEISLKRDEFSRSLMSYKMRSVKRFIGLEQED
jgi:hypothetical protein